MSNLPHGLSRYTNDGCRCAVCREAQRKEIKARRDRYRTQRRKINGRMTSLILSKHGTSNGYVNYGCRCDECTTVHTAYRAEQRKQQRSRA